MTSHPLRDVAIVGVYNSRQARMLEDDNSETIALRAVAGPVTGWESRWSTIFLSSCSSTPPCAWVSSGSA